jgi:hypothetical protein
VGQRAADVHALEYRRPARRAEAKARRGVHAATGDGAVTHEHELCGNVLRGENAAGNMSAFCLDACSVFLQVQ